MDFYLLHLMASDGFAGLDVDDYYVYNSLYEMNKVIIELIQSDPDLFLMRYTEMTLCHVINNNMVDRADMKNIPRLKIETDDVKLSKWTKDWG